VRDPRIADGPKKNRIEVLPEHLKRALRKRDTLTQIFLGTPIELDEFQTRGKYFVHTAQHAHGFVRDVDADAVAGNDCDALHYFYTLMSALYSVTRACRCDSSSFAKSIKILRPLASEICLAKSVKN